MKSFIVAYFFFFCLSMVALCLAVPVEKVSLDSVDADASGDEDAGHDRLVRGFGGYGGYGGGYPRYGGYGGGYPRYGGNGGYRRGGFGGGYGGSYAQASASSSSFGGGFYG